MKYIKEIEVKQCFHGCPFFKTEEGHLMVCGHPYFDGKGAYDNLIITQDNSRDRVPDECPLRTGPVEVGKRIKLQD